MSKMNVKVVKGKDVDGKDVIVVVKRPTPKQSIEGQIVASRAFNQAAIGGEVIYRAGLMKSLRVQGLWGDEQQEELEDLGKKINAGERQINLGGRTPKGEKFSRKQARDLAIDMRVWRNKQLELLSQTRANDEFTVEGMSENSKFEFFMTNCVFNEDEKHHFEDVQAYKDMSNQDHPYLFEAASELANMISQFDPDYEKKLPENKFLVEYGFAREDGRLVNKDGDLVDSKGKRIDEEGRFVNDDGEFIDIYGKRVDEEGSPVEEFVPFAEDEDETEEETVTASE